MGGEERDRISSPINQKGRRAHSFRKKKFFVTETQLEGGGEKEEPPFSRFSRKKGAYQMTKRLARACYKKRSGHKKEKGRKKCPGVWKKGVPRRASPGLEKRDSLLTPWERIIGIRRWENEEAQDG